LESRKKKISEYLNKREFRILEEEKSLGISEKEKSRNLRRRKVSRNEKNLKISKQVKSWNLGISRILESHQPRAQSRNLATSSAISKQAESRKSQNNQDLRTLLPKVRTCSTIIYILSMLTPMFAGIHKPRVKF
jgi:hypothetical protein